jgi:putative tricarboxylic transport membrane protein
MRRLWCNGEAQAELILSLCLIFLSLAVWIAADRLPPPIFDPLGSAAVPKLVALLVAALSIAMLVERFIGAADQGAVPGPSESTDAAAPLRPGIAMGAFVVMVGCPAAMEAGILGFRETTFVLILVLGGILSRFFWRTLTILVPTAAALAVGLSWLFGDVLFVDLPSTSWMPF